VIAPPTATCSRRSPGVMTCGSRFRETLPSGGGDASRGLRHDTDGRGEVDGIGTSELIAEGES